MTTLESNRCYACNKIFCCADCCTEHIRKKHPGRESKCPLCRTEGLMVKNFDNQEFLCHVVFHHLPLCCRLCGERFRSCEELKNLGACNRRQLIEAASAAQEDPSESLLSPETSSFFNKTPCGQLGAKRKEFSIDGDYNGNFGKFTSPPEFSRNTSTPMHANLIGSNANFAFKTPRSPNFTLKTPKTASPSVKNVRRNERSATKENSVSDVTNYKDAESPSSESNYLSLSSLSKSSVIDRTPLRSILSNRSSIGDSSNQEFSRTTGRKLGAMQELNEETGIEEIVATDMDLTDAQGGIIPSEQSLGVSAYENVSQRRAKGYRDSGKRVRFSDQFEIKSEAEVTSAGSLNATEGEEFFEARQSISEMSIAVAEKLSTSSALIDRENEKNSEKEQTEIVAAETKSPEEKDSREGSTVSSSSSSRVVMMVVVEKNSSINAADLAPLIDSSLKKLEGVATSGVTPRENSMAISPRTNQKGTTPGTTVVSVDSYMSVSTVECYATPDSTIDVPQRPRESPEASNSVTGSGGIFSAVAHAMRAAFRNFSGATSSRNIPREHIFQKETPALLSSIPESSAASSKVLASLETAIVPRTAKRSRDADEVQPIQSSDSVDPQNDIRSPLPKRPRGWYKIRAREPIARMRNENNLATSPRGVSSETQCFQQGSLSVGDTILPIPSRAHQSTQTD